MSKATASPQPWLPQIVSVDSFEDVTEFSTDCVYGGIELIECVASSITTAALTDESDGCVAQDIGTNCDLRRSTGTFLVWKSVLDDPAGLFVSSPVARRCWKPVDQYLWIRRCCDANGRHTTC